MIRFLEGSARYLSGAHDLARASLEAALREAGDRFAPSRSLAWSSLALVELAAGRRPEAESAISTARAIASEFGLRDQPPQSIVYALNALTLARAGDREQARREWEIARELVTFLANSATWLAGATGLVLAQTSLQLGEIAAARQVARETESALARIEPSPACSGPASPTC